jgi:hypothetical protein
MISGKLISFPLRNPELFTAEINSEILGNSELRRVLCAAIQALPHVKDRACQQELKSALCELLLNSDAAA